jgi:tRNA(fMet)-specific endonuclease VapC
MKSDIMSDEKILIDTSVWIDYFQNKPSSISEKVDGILSENNIYIPKIVIAELIQGSGSQKEISIIEDFLDAFNIIDQKEDTWVEAGKLSYRLRKKGRAINLADCYIAIIARAYECYVFTLDKHFEHIQAEININLI